jgi:transcription elongation factor SPT5
MSSDEDDRHDVGENAEDKEEYYDEDEEGGGEEEEEDEEEEEEDDDSKRRHKKKKKKKSILQTFFDEEAEDDDMEEEEEEEDEPEEGYEQIIKEKELEQRSAFRDQHKHRELYNKLERDDDVEELANYYKQRYSKNAESNRFGSSDQLSDTIIQQQLLPGFKYINTPYCCIFTSFDRSRSLMK